MYKCKECGAEYEQRPDFCDCGNDEFILSEEPVLQQAKLENTVTDSKYKNENADIKQTSSKIYDSKKDIINARPSIFENINPFSLGLFCFCIILSLVIIFFVWNPKPNPDNNKISEKPSVKQNIPSIDKIWDGSLPVNVAKTEPLKIEKKEELKKVENIVKQIVPTKIQKNVETQKTTQKIQPKVVKVPITKVTTKQKTTKNTVNTPNQEQSKKAAELAAKQKAEQERKDAEAAQLKKLQEMQAQKLAQEKAKQAQIDKQELISYKANLRNTIGRKIDFTRVIGDGSCTVSFKIDENGKLTNRSFSKQSSNNTLNDAVYNAVMSTPTFTAPPNAYKNEILNLSIKFYNGNFEISLP